MHTGGITNEVKKKNKYVLNVFIFSFSKVYKCGCFAHHYVCTPCARLGDQIPRK